MLRSTLLPTGLMMFIPFSACSGLPEGMTDAMRQLSGQAGGSEQARDAMAAAREAAGMGAQPAEETPQAQATQPQEPAPPAAASPDPEVAEVQAEAAEIRAEAAEIRAEAAEVQQEAVETPSVSEQADVDPPTDSDVAVVEPEPSPAAPVPVAPAAAGGTELTVAELSRTSESLQGQTVTVVGSYQQVAAIPACPAGVGVVFIDPSFLDTTGNADVGLIAACTSDAFIEHIAQQPQYNRYRITGPVQHVADPITSAGFSSLVTCDTPEFVGPPELNIQIDLSF